MLLLGRTGMLSGLELLVQVHLHSQMWWRLARLPPVLFLLSSTCGDSIPQSMQHVLVDGMWEEVINATFRSSP